MQHTGPCEHWVMLVIVAVAWPSPAHLLPLPFPSSLFCFLRYLLSHIHSFPHHI